MRESRRWTEVEDDLLRTAVDDAKAEDEQVNWHKIASSIEGRNNKDCRKRWVYSLAPLINKGPWEKTEDSMLSEGVRLHGTRWADVSRIVGSRHGDQCSKRWHEVLKPNIKRDRWSLLEDIILKDAVRAHGRRWIEIVERYFPERTPIGTKNRYDQLLRDTDQVLPQVLPQTSLRIGHPS